MAGAAVRSGEVGELAPSIVELRLISLLLLVQGSLACSVAPSSAAPSSVKKNNREISALSAVHVRPLRESGRFVLKIGRQGFQRSTCDHFASLKKKVNVKKKRNRDDYLIA